MKTNNINLTTELAEICGIIAGDGHLSRYISPQRTHYKVSVFGHKKDDQEYFLEIKDLFENELGKRPILKNRISCIELRLNSKEILHKLERIGISVGNKSGSVHIPKIIQKQHPLSLSFLRGLADTDFSIILKKRKTKPAYPRITADMKSKGLIYDVCNVLKKVGITYYGPYQRKRLRNGSHYTTYQIDINGNQNLDLWIKHIGFRNPKHKNKIENRSSENAHLT